MTWQPRRHQSECVDAIFDHWRIGGGNALASVCVGGGKSAIQAMVAQRLLDMNPNISILGLTMTQELIEQNADEMRTIWPGAPVGVNSAGLSKRQVREKIIFAHPLSIINTMKALGPRHVIMVDEVHNVSRRQEESTYGKIIALARAEVPDLRLLGLSGTLFRLDSGRLHDPWRGKPSIWDAPVYHYGILDGIRDGYLVPLVTPSLKLQLDVSGVAMRGGEYAESQLQAAVNQIDINTAIVDDFMERSRDCHAAIVFATGVDHASNLTSLIQQKGGTAVLLTGEMGKKERAEVVRYFKAGAAKYLVNVGIATTGFNYPECDCAIIVRPTQSSGLFIQMLGRIARAAPWAGKTHALVLDYAGNTVRLGCIDQIDGKKTDSMGGGIAPTKECPSCALIIPAGTMKCTCGHEFERSGPELHAKAIDAPVLSTQAAAEWRNVDHVSYALHQKRHPLTGTPEGAPSLRVVYICGTLQVSEFMSFESEKGKAFARRKWGARAVTNAPPETSLDAFQRAKDELRRPGRIQISKSGKYYEVMAIDLAVPPASDLNKVRT